MVKKHVIKVIAIVARKATLLFWVAIDPGAAGAARHSVIPANHARLAQIPPAHNHRVCLICVVLNRDDFNVRRRKSVLREGPGNPSLQTRICIRAPRRIETSQF